jgi:AcrR family transcriptional regulator
MDVETFAHSSQQLQTPARGDRVARTREAIVGSALALALAGEVAPIVRDIAKMAGVSARTVFQHFADTAELYVAVLGRVMAAALGEVDFNMSWPLDERIAMIINQCSERGERLLPMWTFVETLQRRSTEASEMIVQMYTANRVQLASWFEHELAALPADARHGAGARELGRAARAARPVGRTGARRAGLRRPRRAQRRRAPRVANRASSSSWRSRRPISVRWATVFWT